MIRKTKKTGSNGRAVTSQVNPALQRLRLLTGDGALAGLLRTRVILFGIGGVGSWAAEALIRSGIGHLTIVDGDVVCATNINRQLQATSLSVGRPKTAELGRRLREIRPEADIAELHAVFDATTANTFDLSAYDYVLDCIDTLACKVELIVRATRSDARLFTALGASCKLDPTSIRISSLWKSYNCPLGKYVRKRLRQQGFRDEVTCVYSPEEVRRIPEASIADGSTKPINGSAVHITGTFGFMLAGLVIQDVVRQADELKIS